MSSRLVYQYTGTVTADGQDNFDALDLSNADLLRVHLKVTSNPSGTNPTLNVYLQCRFSARSSVDQDWNDRVSFTQLTGSSLSGEILEAALSKFGTLSDSEELGEPSASLGASRLTVSTVRNGPFPGVYRDASGIGPSWRMDFDVGGTSPSFPIEIAVYADSAA